MPLHSRTPRQPGRPRAKSGLPAPILGQPCSLLATLRRTRRGLTVQDVAELLIISEKTVYKHIKSGLIPVMDLGFKHTLIDPAAWYDRLAKMNPHLVASARAQLQTAA